MTKNIPHLDFKPAKEETFGFEVVPIEKIAKIKSSSGHSPRLPHQLKFYTLIFFTEGSGRHYIDFNWYPVQKNTLIYLSKDQVNAFDFTGDLQGYCIVFTEEFFVNIFSSLTDDFVFRLFNPQLFSPLLNISNESEFIVYFNLLLKEFRAPRSVSYVNIITSLLTIIFSKAESITRNMSFSMNDYSKVLLFQKFSTLVEKHHAESRSAIYYADILAITYKHLNVICKALVQKTAKGVINDFIILKAKRNLINASVNSNELAYQLGFEDPTNFTKYFKKHTGLTPKSFTKSIEKG